MILDVLPFAAGVFASPLPVILGIVLLFTPDPRRTSMVYVVTWLTGLFVVLAFFSVIAGAVADETATRTWVTWIRIILGVGLLVMAIKSWLNRGTKEMPAWLAGLMQAGPKEAFRYGILMSAANPKELLMAVAAGAAIGTSGEGTAAGLAAILVVVVIGGLSVIAPLLVFLLGGDAALERLKVARGWLEANNAVVTAVVLFALGLWLVLGGVSKL